MVKDMTSGSPTKLILFFSIPMLLGNLFQQFYNMVDAMVVGRFVSVGALAAVGATGSMLFTIVGFAMGLTTGFSIVISQRFGAGNEDGVRQAVAMSVYLSLIISAVMTVAGVCLTKPMLVLMNTPEDIMADSITYLRVIFAGVSASIFYNLISSVLRALGDSKTPLYFLVLSSLINVVLDLVFVIQFQMGVAGVAYATIIAQGISFVLCVLYMNKKHPMLHLTKKDWIWDNHTIGELVRMGLPTAFMNSVTGLGILILQVVVNGFGSTIVAAYTAANKVQQLAHQPLMSFGLAMATYVGQNLGAGRYDRIRKGVRSGLLLSSIGALAGAALVAFGGGLLVQMFVSGEETEVIDKAHLYLIISATLYVVLGALFIYRYSLQGLGNAMVPMISGFLELALRVGFSIVLPRYLGFVGIPMADISAWVGAGLLLGIAYYRNIRILEQGRRT